MRRLVAELVQHRLGDLRPAERRVGRALLADYPRAGLDTATALAKVSGVSPPTVVRFTHALGFDGYAELQSTLRDEVAFRSQGPLGHNGWERPDGELGRREPRESRLAGAAQLCDAALATVRSLPESEWTAAVIAISDSARTLTCVGGRCTGILARLLAGTLEMVRPGVVTVTDPFGADVGRLIDMGRKDVVVAFDIPRYQSATIEMVAVARRQKAAIILVTDERLSPAAAHADVVLPVSLASPSPFAGMTAATMLVELLILAVIERLGPAAQQRIDAWESYRLHELVHGALPFTAYP